MTHKELYTYSGLVQGDVSHCVDGTGADVSGGQKNLRSKREATIIPFQIVFKKTTYKSKICLFFKNIKLGYLVPF